MTGDVRMEAVLRIDVVTIFPAYLDAAVGCRCWVSRSTAANGSDLAGARPASAWTDDVHHSVDDTPYGGGAGMVMMRRAVGVARWMN